MCGAVTFTAQDVPDTYGACHCEMCRRWTGSALLAATVPAQGLTWTGETHIGRLQSSDWAERAWCQRCGTGLYCRITVDGPVSENYQIPVGLFDDSSGMTLAREIFSDRKMPGWAIAGDLQRQTRKEIMTKFGISDDEGAA